ncbi:MAG: hypothetical protein JST92_17885 [Deltaproteobacteria bacterium]|nr:hypothetical protein [Deltaproteobacteria bacterium]
MISLPVSVSSRSAQGLTRRVAALSTVAALSLAPAAHAGSDDRPRTITVNAREATAKCPLECVLRATVARAKPGQTVPVPAGLYALTAPILVPANVTLLGDTTVRDATHDGLGAPTTSRDLTILEGAGIHDTWAGPGFDDRAQGRIIIASKPGIVIRGFTFQNSDPNLVKNAIFSESGQVVVDGNAIGTAKGNNFWRGLWFFNGADAEVTNNLVSTQVSLPLDPNDPSSVGDDGTAAFSFEACVSTDGGPQPGPFSSRVLVSGNTTRGNTRYGVRLFASGDNAPGTGGCHLTATILGNDFTGGEPSPGNPRGTGIQLSGGVSFFGSGATGNMVSALLMQNHIRHWGFGILGWAAIQGFDDFSGGTGVVGNKLDVTTAANRVSDCSDTAIGFTAAISSLGPASGNETRVLMLGDEMDQTGAAWFGLLGLIPLNGFDASGTGNHMQATLLGLDLDGTAVNGATTDPFGVPCSQSYSSACHSTVLEAAPAGDTGGNTATCRGPQCPPLFVAHQRQVANAAMPWGPGAS